MIPIATTRRWTVLLLTAFCAIGMTASAIAQGNENNNKGTIKVHDDAEADPETRNEPHVSCDFWVEGFNMQGSEGHLVFYAWPPTGDKGEVTPDGDGLEWTGEEENDTNGGYHFLNGPYQLEPGHYRVEAYDDHDGHPGHESHFVKAKMFWVDDCETGEPVCDEEVEDCEPEVECPEDSPAEECEEIPFFPSAAAGAVGLLGCVGAYTAMRRKTAS